MDEALLLDFARAAVEACAAEQAEAVCSEEVEAVTRFANNVIHQSMSDRSRSVTVRAVIGKRIGVANGIIASADDAVRVARRAYELAEVAAELPDFVSLPEPEPLPPQPAEPAADVLAATPAVRAELVAGALDRAKASSLSAAGALTTSSAALAVANSLGVGASRTFTRAHFHVVMQGEDSGGYAAAEGPALADTCAAEVAERAVRKAELGRNPVTIAPAPMTVVFEPVAAAELFEFMGFMGFNAMSYQEEQSFACDLLGEQACAKALNLTDDGLDTRTYAAAFDFEGAPKRRVGLIEGGTISSLVYDSYTSRRADPPADNTGHALPAPNTWGPVPTNMIVAPGDATMDELIAGVDRGLFVSRIHYLNIVHPRQLILTGMTREGTFLIEKGEIVGGVRNLRFTERFVDALGRLSGLGRDGELHGSVWLPPMVLDGFTFTSGTQF